MGAWYRAKDLLGILRPTQWGPGEPMLFNCKVVTPTDGPKGIRKLELKVTLGPNAGPATIIRASMVPVSNIQPSTTVPGVHS